MKKILVLVFVVLSLSGCSDMRKDRFMEIVQPQSESDELVANCLFDEIDDEMVESFGTFWTFDPRIQTSPRFFYAMKRAVEACDKKIQRPLYGP